MAIIKTFDFKRLRPFRKSGNQIPRLNGDEERLQQYDPDLKPEEESYVRHYLSYADVLLEKDQTGEDKPFEGERRDDRAA